MALCRLKFQIPSVNQPHPTQLLKLCDKSVCKNLPSGAKRISSWFGKKETIKKEPSKSKPQVFLKSACRKRVPQCPEFIGTGAPSKCVEDGYGDPVSKLFSFRYRPRSWIKHKPSNCLPPPCDKRQTFWQYIFGHEKPLPHPNTCRMAYKYKQMRNAEDPRLKDPRYKMTDGDVLIFTEEIKAFCLTPTKIGPRPKNPAPFKVPSSVICKSISDSVGMLDCYCACVPTPKEPCDSNLCPVHSWSNKRPYEEMRPLKPQRTFFACKRGLPGPEVTRAPRYSDCSCFHPRIEQKRDSEFPPSPDCCAYHGQAKVDLQENASIATKGKMSRNERLKSITSSWDADLDANKFARKPPLPCIPKCQTRYT